MKIACIGSNLESEVCLNHFLSNGFIIDLLITRPEHNSGSVSDYVNLHPWCKENKVEVVSTLNVNSKETIDEIKSHGIDVLLTLGWSQIFKKEFRDSFNLVIGSHPTILPEGRGRAPIPWTIINRLERTGVSFFVIDEGVDTGEIILQRQFDISQSITASVLYKEVANHLSVGFMEIITKLKSGNELLFDKISVNEELSYSTAKRIPSDGILDFTRSAIELETLVRAITHPYPGAYTFYNDKRIRVFSAWLGPNGKYYGAPGQILKIVEGEILVSCGAGTLWLGLLTDDFGMEIDTKNFRLHEHLSYSILNEIFEIKKQLKKLKEKNSELG
jgi:methionyl-tRNA formyltransferase